MVVEVCDFSNGERGSHQQDRWKTWLRPRARGEWSLSSPTEATEGLWAVDVLRLAS